ncbi:co-chaperone GroES [Patescibacteria group bacterium]
MKLKPLADRVVVKPLREDEVTKSGIVIPDTVEKERPEKGEVLAVGPGKLLENGERRPVAVQVGDIVLFKKHSPDEFKLDGEEYLLLEESDLIGLLEK